MIITLLGMSLSLILVMILQSVSSLCSPDEFIVVDGDTDEEFWVLQTCKKAILIRKIRYLLDTEHGVSKQIGKKLEIY